MLVKYSGLLSQPLKQRFEQQIENALLQWVKAWCVDGAKTLAIEKAQYNSGLFQTRQKSIDQAQLIFAFDDCVCCFCESKGSLAELALNIDKQNQADNTLGQFIADKMRSQLAEHFKHEQSARQSHCNEFDYACSVTFSLGQHKLALLFSDLYLHRLARTDNNWEKGTTGVVLLKDLVQQRPLRLQLSMDSEPVTVGQLMSLKVGHVIPLKQKIKAPLELKNKPEQTRLKGYLVKNDGQKAVYITGFAK